MKTRIIIIAKAPLPGLAKTRLIPALGEQAAADLAARMLQYCVAQALSAKLGVVELCVSPSLEHAIWQELNLPAGLHWSLQSEGDLGARLRAALARVDFEREQVLLIGSDCPELNVEHLTQAASALQQHELVMLPVSDGGYALLGMRCYHPSVFEGIRWSSDKVAEQTRCAVQRLGATLFELETLHDIDIPKDLVNLPSWITIDK